MTSKQGMTLEQRIKRELRVTCRPNEAVAVSIEQIAAFARVLLNEARPYIAHKPDCADLFGEPCSCGLAELLRELEEK